MPNDHACQSAECKTFIKLPNHLKLTFYIKKYSVQSDILQGLCYKFETVGSICSIEALKSARARQNYFLDPIQNLVSARPAHQDAAYLEAFAVA